jgi:hypothetical protein
MMTQLEVDGKEVKIPRKVRGILVLNMPSYAGGTQPWGTKKEAQVPTTPVHARVCCEGLEAHDIGGGG